MFYKDADKYYLKKLFLEEALHVKQVFRKEMENFFIDEK